MPETQEVQRGVCITLTSVNHHGNDFNLVYISAFSLNILEEC